MLKIVDPQLNGFAAGNRAKVPAHREAPLVCDINHFLQLVARDVHERLERSHALICPELGGLARVLRPREFVDLHPEIAFPFHVGASQVNFGTGNLASSIHVFRFKSA